MGRPERALDAADGPLAWFALDLRRLRAQAGGLPYRELSRRAHYSTTTLSEAAGGSRLPTLAVTLAYVEACGGDREEWARRWRDVDAALAAEHAEDGDAARAPYPGLNAFEAHDAERFFGRERLVAELCSRLSRGGLLAVFGASGAGKSSLLRAGLLPAVRGGGVPAGVQWPTLLCTPGDDPLGALARALADGGDDDLDVAEHGAALRQDPDRIQPAVDRVLARHAPEACLLLVVDQFEEVFTHCSTLEERRAFVAAVLAAARHDRVRVVLGVRADFYARCAEHADLVAALRDGQLLMGPMGDDELRRVITGPARQAGAGVEAALVEAVVADARDQDGALPLVSHALLETWRRRRNDTLTLAGYRASGGVAAAIAVSAERVYEQLDDGERATARELFLRLIALGDGTDDVRRRAPRAELAERRDAAAMATVLDRMIAARLVTADADSVTLAHEALIRAWPRLRGWLTEDRERRRAQRLLTEAAAEWQRHDRDDALLYRGPRLAAWDGWPLDRLTDSEAAFLVASRRHAARERAARRRRVRVAIGGLSVALVAVAALAAVALVQADRAAAGRRMAVSRQLAAEARVQLAVDPERALRLAGRAYRVEPTVEADSALRQAVVDDREVGRVRGHRGRALGVAFSPDGRWLATSSDDGAVRLWPWRSGAPPDAPSATLSGHDGEVWSPVFSADGRRLVTAGLDGTVRVWDAERQVPVRVLRGHRGPVWNVAFAPGGGRVASAGDDGTARVWRIDGGGRTRMLRGHDGPVVAVAFSPDGRHLATAGHDRVVVVWDLSDGSRIVRLTGHEDAVKRLAFSPDGTRLASVAVDGTARVWRASAWDAAPAVLRGHDGRVEGVAFSPDGAWLATTSDDATIGVWNPSGEADRLVLRGHRGTVWSTAFSPDGRWLASASEDGTVRLWEPRAVDGQEVLRGHEGPTWVGLAAGDGRGMVSAGSDGTVRVWPPGGGAARVHDVGDEVVGLDVSADGRRLAAAVLDGSVRIWDSDGARSVVLRGHDGPAWMVAFSPDGRRVASVGGDGTLRLRDSDGRGPAVVRETGQGLVRYVAFSPDGRQVATAGEDGTVRLRRADGRGDPRVLRGHDGLVWALAYGPDGRLASAGSDGTVRIWEIPGRDQPLVLRGHRGFVWYVAFSPDGRWIASTGDDDTVRLWRASGAGEAVVHDAFGASVESVSFADGGRHLVTAHGDGTVRRWRCSACASAEQLLTAASGARR